MKAGPLRKIVERRAGTSKLECGHIVNTPRPATLRVRCFGCLSLEERQRVSVEIRENYRRRFA